ncbi:MAG: rubredoxin [Eubacteriales bacterium]|jgi:rubredoxin|nr:rubredoxin [Clostridiales bacterium]
MKYVCTICGYVYDEEKGEPDSGIQPGTKWDDVSEDFVCPVCGAPKDAFEKSDE